MHYFSFHIFIFMTVRLNDLIFDISMNMCGLISSLIFLFSSANKCLLKVATYAAQLEQYPKAIEIYEQVR